MPLGESCFCGDLGESRRCAGRFFKSMILSHPFTTIFLIHSGHRRGIFRWYEDFLTISSKSRSRTFFLLPAQLRYYYSDSITIYSDYVLWLLVLVAICFYICDILQYIEDCCWLTLPSLCTCERGVACWSQIAAALAQPVSSCQTEGNEHA